MVLTQPGECAFNPALVRVGRVRPRRGGLSAAMLVLLAAATRAWVIAASLLVHGAVFSVILVFAPAHHLPQEILQHRMTVFGQDRLRVELYALDA